jgi:phosphoglucomutase
MGKDTHAVSEPAQRTALEVLAANGVETVIQRDGGVTPTPVISWAILVYNRGRKEHLADGIVVTPSHNPPRWRLQIQPTQWRPADTEVTGGFSVGQRAAAQGQRRCEADTYASAIKAAGTHEDDLVVPT